MRQLFIVPGVADITDNSLRAGIKGLRALLAGDFRVHCVGKGQTSPQPRENLWIVYLVSVTESGSTIETFWPHYRAQPIFKVYMPQSADWITPLVEAINAAARQEAPSDTPALSDPVKVAGIAGTITLISLPEPPAGSPVVVGHGMHELQSPPEAPPQGDIPADVSLR